MFWLLHTGIGRLLLLCVLLLSTSAVLVALVAHRGLPNSTNTAEQKQAVASAPPANSSSPSSANTNAKTSDGKSTNNAAATTSNDSPAASSGSSGSGGAGSGSSSGGTSDTGDTTPTGGWTRPTSANTGPTGTLSAWGKSTTFTANNQTIKDIDFGGYIKVTGSNLIIDNCRFVGMVFYGPGPLTVKNCLSDGGSINIDGYYRNISGITFNHVHVICANHDGIDIFSSASGLISNVSISDSLVDGQTFPSSSTAHGDGLQVRGVHGLDVQRFVVDMYTVGGVQPQKNSALYFENVYGGGVDMHFTDVELWGGDPYNHTFYTSAVTSSTATNLSIKRGGYTKTANPSGWTFTNVTGPSGVAVSP